MTTTTNNSNKVNNSVKANKGIKVKTGYNAITDQKHTSYKTFDTGFTMTTTRTFGRTFTDMTGARIFELWYKKVGDEIKYCDIWLTENALEKIQNDVPETVHINIEKGSLKRRLMGLTLTEMSALYTALCKAYAKKKTA